MTENAGTLAATYFQAWKAKDFATLRSVLADDATFRGRSAAPTTPRPASRG